ncbi:MAG: STAS domain-containing protein [Calditrichaceae bacterium]
MDQNDVVYTIENQCLFLKMLGSIRHTVCSNLDALTRKVIKQDEVDKFVIDLRETTYLDSTSLGIIARMARYAKGKSGQKIVLVSINEDVNQILNSEQFGSIAKIVENWDKLPEKYFKSELFLKEKIPDRDLLIESHQELAKINEDNRKKFTAVIESLEKKYKKKNKK